MTATKDDSKPCIDCGDPTWNEHGRCRDCDIQHHLDEMECKTCKHMRYRTDVSVLSEFGAYLWGDPCVCPPASTDPTTNTADTHDDR